MLLSRNSGRKDTLFLLIDKEMYSFSFCRMERNAVPLWDYSKRKVYL